jgi:hypothetical protein
MQSASFRVSYAGDKCLGEFQNAAQLILTSSPGVNV